MLVTLIEITQEGEEAKKTGKATTETLRMMIPRSMLFENALDIFVGKVDSLIAEKAVPIVKFLDSRSRLRKFLEIDHKGRTLLRQEVEQFFKDNPTSMVILTKNIEGGSVMSMTNV